MNIHVSDKIKEKYPNYEFIGNRIKLSDGKFYIKAFHKVLGNTHVYSYEDDFFWFDRKDIIPLLKA